MAVVGPGAQREIPTDVRPMLEGANEFEYVTLLNILTDDFAVRVGQDVPVNMPFDIKNKTTAVQSGNDVVRNYGLDLKNPDYVGKKHIAIDTIIPAGQTRRFKGNEARVAVTQLVNEYMQRTGQTKQMADPEARSVVEGMIIQSRGSIQDLMDAQMQTPRDQADEAIRKANEVADAQPFPGLNRESSTEVGAAGEASGADSVQQERRGPGRPKQVK